MNPRTGLYLQAIRGPVLLVTAGVLFAIHQAGVLSFSRTWPLLIIVIGLMKLLERAWAPAGPWPATEPPYRGGAHAAPQSQYHPTGNNAGQPQGPGAV